ncbi:MAG: FadR/GntR family transcriptional regulator [Cellulosilyticaceae bacterium]
MLEKIGHDRPLPELVAEEIVDLIIQKKLQPGNKLPSEAELASSLGVGRSTLREAIRILISKNIVMIKRGLGTYVSEKMGVTDDPLGFIFIQDKKKLLIDTLDIRLMIEPKIAEVAALMATESEIENMERLCDEVENLILSGENHIEKDIELHTQIAKSSQNLVISKLLPIINGSIPIFIDVTKSALKNETISTHRAVVQAIRDRDEKKAFEFMEKHILYNKTLIESLSIE